MAQQPVLDKPVFIGPFGGIDEETDIVAISAGDLVKAEGIWQKQIGSLHRAYGKVATLQPALPVWAIHQFFGFQGVVGNIWSPGTLTTLTVFPPVTKIPPYDNPPTELPTDDDGDTNNPFHPSNPVENPSLPEPTGQNPGIQPGNGPTGCTDYPITQFVEGWDRYDGNTAEHLEYIWANFHVPEPPPAGSLPGQGPYTHSTATQNGDGLRDSQTYTTTVQLLSAPSGITVGHQENRYWTGSYTQAYFNFSAYSGKRIYLIGSYAYVKSNGSTETGPCWQDISGYAGVSGNLRVYAPQGEIYYSSNPIIGANSKLMSGWVSYTGVRICPPSKDPYEDN